MMEHEEYNMNALQEPARSWDCWYIALTFWESGQNSNHATSSQMTNLNFGSRKGQTQVGTGRISVKIPQGPLAFQALIPAAVYRHKALAGLRKSFVDTQWIIFNQMYIH